MLRSLPFPAACVSTPLCTYSPVWEEEAWGILLHHTHSALLHNWRDWEKPSKSLPTDALLQVCGPSQSRYNNTSCTLRTSEVLFIAFPVLPPTFQGWSAYVTPWLHTPTRRKWRLDVWTLWRRSSFLCLVPLHYIWFSRATHAMLQYLF